MKQLVQIPLETAEDLKNAAQTGPGYQVVSVELVDGRIFDPVMVSEGHVIQVRGFRDCPLCTGGCSPREAQPPTLEFQAGRPRGSGTS
jgi:hypothetical protein